MSCIKHISKSLISGYSEILEQQGYSYVHLRDGLYVFRMLPERIRDFTEEDWKYFNVQMYKRSPLPLDWQFS